MQQIKSCQRKSNQTDAKSFIMETTEKIQSGLKSELRSGINPFVDFAKSIKKIDNQNFIVEWQIEENEIRKSNENLASDFIFV
jgi:hypothetical protein